MAQEPRNTNVVKRITKYPTAKDIETRELIVTEYFVRGLSYQEIRQKLENTVCIGTISKYECFFSNIVNCQFNISLYSINV